MKRSQAKLTTPPSKRQSTPPNDDLKRFRQAQSHASFKASANYGTSADAKCTTVLRGLEARLVSEIDSLKKDDFAMFAIAWLSNKNILRAMAQAKQRGCFIVAVVQKEDFLRPDSRSRSDFGAFLRPQYDALGSISIDNNSKFDHIVRHLSQDSVIGEQYHSFVDSSLSVNIGGNRITAVRCLGNHNKDKDPAFPRMHNKFVVFGHFNKEPWPENKEFYSKTPVPTKVWTGSFNCSASAEKSFENAVIIESEEIATSYAKEFVLLLLLSEPLDWTSEWMAPSLEYGT